MGFNRTLEELKDDNYSSTGVEVQSFNRTLEELKQINNQQSKIINHNLKEIERKSAQSAQSNKSVIPARINQQAFPD